MTWYIEIIDAYGYWKKEMNIQNWSYDRPYKKGENPQDEELDGGIPFLPNFGVEVKF